jgi:hypothetical protein
MDVPAIKAKTSGNQAGLNNDAVIRDGGVRDGVGHPRRAGIAD